MSLVRPPQFLHLQSSRHSSAGKKRLRLRLEALEDRTLLSSISGTVFNDLNGDGVLQAGEPGLPGWEVDLLQDQTVKQRFLTTDGNFIFSVDPGTFTIREVPQTNWL